MLRRFEAEGEGLRGSCISDEVDFKERPIQGGYTLGAAAAGVGGGCYE